MGESLAILGGIVAALQVGQSVVELIKNAKEAPSERQRLLVEIHSTIALCQALKDYVDIDAKEWTLTLQTIGQNQDGPLDRFHNTLQYLQGKLMTRTAGRCGPKDRLIAWTKVVNWPFAKSEILKIIADIERQKSLFSLALTSDNTRLSVAMLNETRDVSKDTKAIRLNQEHEKQRSLSDQDCERRQAFLSNLSSIDSKAHHRDVSSQRANNTGGWLNSFSDYICWQRQETSSIFWCCGIPGAGKTVLASFVVDTVLTSHAQLKDKKPRSVLAYHYYSFRTPHTATDVMRSILRQLLTHLDFAIDDIQLCVDSQRLSSAFQEILQNYTDIFLVIDALDECTGPADLLKHLNDLLRATLEETCSAAWHIFITSRESATNVVEKHLTPDWRLDLRCRDEDVETYLRHIFHEHIQLSNWIEETPSFGTLIIDAILAQISGMFLLARLYIDLIAHIPTKRGVRRALDNLPRDIGDTYAEAWDRICAQKPPQRQLGQHILLWLQCALAIEDGDIELDTEGILDAGLISSFCAGLVVTNEESGLVKMVHPTTQEYFDARKEQLFPNAHEVISVTCITYLKMKPFKEQGSLADTQEFQERCRSSPFLGYTAVNWGIHVQRAKTRRAAESALSLLNNDRVRQAAAQALILNSRDVAKGRPEWPVTMLGEELLYDFNMSLSALHLAAYFGLIDVAESLLMHNNDVDALDSGEGTALHWAVLGKQDNMSKFLLDRGACANARKKGLYLRRWHMIGFFTLPLTIAAYQGSVSILEYLVQNGIDVNDEQYDDSVTAFSAALFAEQQESVKFLLAHGADIDKNYWAIMDVVEDGRAALLKILLEADIKVFDRQDALRKAAAAGDYDKVALLLEHGVVVDGGLPKPYPTSNCGHEESLGHDMVATDSGQIDEVTPLVTLIVNAWQNAPMEPLACLVSLLDAGASVNAMCPRTYILADDFTAEGRYFTAPLGRATTAALTAAYYGRLDILRILAERGANINIVLEPHHTALASALKRESYFLDALESGPSDLGSTLHVRETLQLLVELGAGRGLCTPEDRHRIDQLLNMSAADCERVAALQEVVKQPRFPVPDRNKTSFRDRIKKLKHLIERGADPQLCCFRDKQRIEQFLAWSEDEIQELDDEREAMREKLSML
ncbi:MAG: hypothetical protein Q9214_002825 [Letrouitia sp. 1 TL-2023]